MFEILIPILITFGPSLMGGLGIGLLYFYWMRHSIRLAVRSEHAVCWLAFFTLVRLACLAGILFAVLQQGLGRLVFFMIGFTVARFILVASAAYESGENKHAV